VQLQVRRQFDDGTVTDLTGLANWRVEPQGAAVIEANGYLRPLAAGKLAVKAAIEGDEVVVSINVEPREDRAWDFAGDVIPILTRLGCNTGSCHGRAEGQNGFHLSLFGYDPEGDYQSLVREGGQRRVTLLHPEQSLFLTKATGRTPHAGGPRVLASAPEYGLLLAWIKAGAPLQRGKSHGAVVAVNVEPATIRLSEPGPAQLRVLARYADGHTRDVTRQSLYKVNDDSSASVSPEGRGQLLRRTEADVIVRYQSHVQSARMATVVNPTLELDFGRLPRQNFIDDELYKRLNSLKVPPSPPASDAAFLRRVSLDLTCEQPTPEQIRRFLADKDPDKRVSLVDRLLARPEFVLFWRIKLGDLLQISQGRQGNGAYRYQDWIDRCLNENTPWDVMVTRMLTALGDPNDLESGGPVNYAFDTLEANVQAEQTAQRFLGLRMRCAQCHDHPFDVWTQDDYFGLAAFFAKVQRGGMGAGAMMGRASLTVNPKGQVIHLRTKRPAQPRLPGGQVVTVAAADDPRQALARWMTAPDNRYFARATANWVWAQFFGKGLVDPPDDLSRSNPPVHPELLDALARHFVAKKYDLRDLVRTIATSQAYGLSSATIPGNERDSRLFSHQTPRPLTAHQMADALAQATDVPNTFGNLPARLAIRVADPSVASVILDTFGRCPRTNACASVQTSPLSLKQSLLLIGGDTIQAKVTHLGGYLASALKLELEPEELIENLYLRTVCRPPGAEELSHWSAELKQAPSLREAAEDLFWSLLNSREFAFNH
jgi:hypothetical protein